MKCLFDPFGCLQNGIYLALAGVPWWAWALILLALVGLAWRLAGWPGLIALGVAIGYALGRNPRILDRHENVSGQDAIPPVKKRRKTIFGRN